MALRRIALGVFAAVGVAVVSSAIAFACVPSARLGLSTASGVPGDKITVSGASFGVPVNAKNPVQIRWNGAEGPLLAEVRPDPLGNFSIPVTVPDGPAGAYAITAVWLDEEGNTGAGTPARAVFEIRVPGATAVTTPAAAPAPQAAAPVAAPTSASSFPVGLVIGLGVLGLALFGGGFVAVTRSRKASATPERVRRG